MPANNLPSLRSDFDQLTAVQRTTFSIDAPGRFLCHTLSEALSPEVPSGPGLALTADFDAIVIGSGMYGAFCADRLVRNGAKVLVLEAGPFLTGQHVQNPPNIGLPFGANVVGSVGNQATDETDALVWGLPWRGNQEFGRLAFCVGGKSVFWGGWAPRLTDDVLDEALPGGVTWPAEVASYLRTYYPRIELQMGVSELKVLAAGQASTPVVRTDLFNSAENKLTAVLEAKLNSLVGNVSVGPGGATRTLVEGIDPAPIAVQADAPASGVFAFNKFSSLPLLLATSREDFALSGGDQLRRLFIVPNVRVLGLDYDPNAKRVTGIRISQAPGRVGVGPHTRVVLALSAIESTRLAQASFGAAPRAAKLQGRNLMAHLRNNFSVRIKRSALNILPGASLQTAAFHIRCKASNGLRYHFQYYAGFQPGNTAESLLYSSIVHTDTVQGVLANQDPEWVAMTFRGCGEMIGQTSRATGDDGASYVNLSNEIDQFGDRRAWVNLVQQREDLQAFDEMDEAGFALALGLAGNNPANIEYFDAKENKFVPQNPYARGGDRFGLLRGEGKGGIRDGLGTTYHDCGTLWMGEDPNTSVTDPNGRFHDATNVYCADQALFPRGGSANPVPTGLLLARRAAEAIVNGDLQVVAVEVGGEVVAHHYAVEPGFEPLFVFDRDPVPAPPTTGKTIPNLPRGWKHLGDGTFTSQGLSIETRGGIGLLIYEADQNLKDFVLRLQWRAPTIRNNSGVYVRLPSALLTDAGKLIKTGYEVQIDNTGERPGDQKDFPFPTESFNPFHITGAVYPVHPTDGFPTQLPQPNGAPARLDVPTRDLALWNDLEITARGNRIAILLNGQPTLTSGDYVDQANRYPSGLIALQNHFKGLRVQFRHVRLKRL